MKILPNDTIAAIATPPGEGALAVIRLSGPRALEIGDAMFRGRGSLASSRGYTVHHGRIVGAGGREIDEGLATVFRGPRSYTGEDVVEVSCHGGLFVTHAVLASALAAGARNAAPGEFTRRAYLNGKMDLSRAEAVAALIASRSDRAHRASLDQLRGRLAGAVDDMRTGMKSLCALLEVDLDFSEEGISVVGRSEIESKITLTKEHLERLAGTFRAGRIYRDGVSVVIVGPPNAGKSSLFNALLKDSRAIVTPIPGTTRDYLEENITIQGILFCIKDTAGLRSSDDPVESEGIARSLSSVESGDIVLVVVDASAGLGVEARLVQSLPLTGEQSVILVRNKIDLIPAAAEGLAGTVPEGMHGLAVGLSALTGRGVHALAEQLVSMVGRSGLDPGESVCVISERHCESLLKGARSLGTALSSIRSGLTNEFVAFDLREAVSALGEITGEITSDDILNSIFSEFCIGK